MNHTIRPFSIAAVVVTFNRRIILQECLEALSRQTYHLSAVIIMDNGSTDGTREYGQKLTALGPTSVIYQRSEQNIGGAGGFAKGITVALEKGFDWIWVMDDDTEPAPDALEKLLVHADDPHRALTPLLVTGNGVPLLQHRGYLGFNKCSGRAVIPVTSAQIMKRDRVPVTHSSFVGLLLPRTIIEDIGVPDASFFLFFDDVEYCIRLSQRYAIDLVPASIIKDKGASTENVQRRMHRRLPFSWPIRPDLQDFWKEYYSTRNHLYLARKYQANHLKMYATLFKYLIKTALKIVFFDRIKLPRLKLIFKATVDGFQGNLGKTVDPADWISRYTAPNHAGTSER